MKRLIRTSPGFALALCAAIEFLSSAAVAQIPCTGPNAVCITDALFQTYPEFDDFATVELGNAWDMSQRRDIGFETEVENVTNNGGIWSAQTAIGQIGGTVFPLFAGDPVNRLNGFPQSELGLPKFGLDIPIDADKYTLLSFKMKAGARTTISIGNVGTSIPSNGTGDADTRLVPAGASSCSFTDTRPDGTFNPPNSLAVYQFDLKSGPCGPGWTGLKGALSITPSTGAPGGTQIAFDWIRLSKPGTVNPDFLINWQHNFSSCNTPNNCFAKLYMDTDNNGFDGAFVGEIVGNPILAATGTFLVKRAALPPGNHYFYVEVNQIAPPLVSTSGYLQLAVDAKPTIVFKSPAEDSGQDYAQLERAGQGPGAPWDMSTLTDVVTTATDFYSAASIATDAESLDGGNVFSGLADASTFTTQPRVTLAGGTNAIDPRAYRYVTFRLKGDDTNYPTVQNKVADGWRDFVRFVNGTDGSSLLTKPAFLYEGMHTYSVDMWNGANFPNSLGWNALTSVSALSITPFVPSIPTGFKIDSVKLTKENATVAGIYPINLSIFDGGNSNSVTIDLFYSADAAGTLLNPITTVLQIPGLVTYNWNTTSPAIPNGRYYIFARVTDPAQNVTFRRANAPVVVGAAIPPPPPPPPPPTEKAPNDSDGDGKSDHMVYRPSNGKFYQDLSGSQSVSRQWVAGSQYTPCTGDFDGDRIADLCLSFEWYGYRAWYYHRSSNNSVSGFLWGYPTDQAAIADYDGDGKDQIAVFREGAWFILPDDSNQGVLVKAWGQAGDLAMPADYDGDKKADLTIWRPADGNWWILKTTTNETDADTVQWGLPGMGDVPLTGDFNGDGTLDLAIYRAMGAAPQWFILDRLNSRTVSEQWGLAGDIPVVGDYDGDGADDLTVLRPGSYVWYHKYYAGTTGSKQYGLPGDLIPR